MAVKKKNKKVVKYRRPLNINVGMIIFALIFLYMIFSVYTYISRDKVKFYEVTEGSIVNHKNYIGIILRDEQVKTADRSGYVNYYVREGKRASVGTKVYSIDETGSVAEFLEENQAGNTNLTEENLSDLRKQLSLYSMSYEDRNFDTVYDMKYSLDAAILEYANFNALDNIESLMSQRGINFQQVSADQAGVVSYSVDSYETLDKSQISEAVFDRSAYMKSITKSGQLIENGAPVYKIITSDVWSVIFQLSEEDIQEFGTKERITVSLDGGRSEITGNFSLLTGTDAKTYGKVDFDKYMVQYVSDRFVEVEVISNKVEGLKIPVSAVTEKNFYLIPIEYLTQGGDSMEPGFLKEVYSEKGTSTVFIPAVLYNADDEFYYINTGSGQELDLNAGDYIVKPDSSDRYQIGATASLQGVYNINKGYAVFKQIDIQASNNEFYTIRKNMDYGLAVYDHIVLDASLVYEGELIYQ